MSLLRVGLGQGGRLRAGPWRGDAQIAYIAPSRHHVGPISAGDVRHCLDTVAAEGYRSVLTAALPERELDPFVELGFTVAQRLHLLVHPLDRLPAPAPLGPPEPASRTGAHDQVGLRRPRRRDRAAALAVDHAAFDHFWRLDEPGLNEALTATSSVHFRVAHGPAGVVGYAVTGRAEQHGYVQRLAVAPDVWGRGIGAALLVDGLRWLRRWGARDAVVNTQEGNERSLRLYQRTGFVVQPEGLAVMRRDLPPGLAR